VVTHQLQVERRTGKVRRPETDVLPLSHASNLERDNGYLFTRADEKCHASLKRKLINDNSVFLNTTKHQTSVKTELDLHLV